MEQLSVKMLLNEKLDWIAKGTSLEEQIQRTKQVAKIDGTFAPLMRMAVLDAEKMVGMPAGMPETYKPDTSMPDGFAHTDARGEFRRIKNFQAGGSMQKVPGHQREKLWVQMLEGMHWKEANVMVHIKDQTLLSIYPNMREVLTALGAKITIPETPVKPKKKKKGSDI
jgi:hypothetical protein